MTVAVIPFCVLAVYYVAWYYIRTSRQIRLLEIEAKAPLFSQFLEALSGLSSIRAYGWSEHYRLQNQIALDASQRPFYMLYCIQRWLSLVLDLIVAGIAVAVIVTATSMRGSSSFNLFGIALFNIVISARPCRPLLQSGRGWKLQLELCLASALTCKMPKQKI